MSVKELKSIDITSFTVISAGIATLTSILISLLIVIGLSVSVPNSFGIMVLIIPTIVCGILISSIFLYFSEGYLYNLIAKKITLKFDIEDGTVNKISTKETALIVLLITLIISIVVYLAFSLILPLFLSSIITIFMYAYLNDIAAIFYQLMIVVASPLFIIIAIIAGAIITSVFALLGSYIFNILGDSERGIKVKLSKENNLTVLDSIDPLSFAISIGAIGLILNIILGIILIISGYEMLYALTNILTIFISIFIGCLLIAAFYNFLAPRIGKLKFELE